MPIAAAIETIFSVALPAGHRAELVHARVPLRSEHGCGPRCTRTRCAVEDERTVFRSELGGVDGGYGDALCALDVPARELLWASDVDEACATTDERVRSLRVDMPGGRSVLGGRGLFGRGGRSRGRGRRGAGGEERTEKKASEHSHEAKDSRGDYLQV